MMKQNTFMKLSIFMILCLSMALTAMVDVFAFAPAHAEQSSSNDISEMDATDLGDGETLADTFLLEAEDTTLGQLPMVLYDFEDGLGTWGASTAGAGTKSTVSVGSYESGDPVRFGEKSLKIDFDFTDANGATTNGVYAGPPDIATGEGEHITGSPKAIGMWVYATEEAQGYWLRFTFRDGNNKAKTVDFAPNIDWLGWNYVQADISSFTGPFHTFNFQTVRVMTTAAMVEAGLPLTKGRIYIDNVRAVYGVQNDDLEPPVIDDIIVSDTRENPIKMSVFFRDSEGEFSTGIDFNKVFAFIDGKKYTDLQIDEAAKSATIAGVTLPSGKHKIDFIVQDHFGNETTKSTVIDVHAHGGITVSVESGETATIGKTYEIKLNASLPQAVDTVTAKMKIASDFTVADVQFLEETGSGYSYENGMLTLTAKGNAVASPATIATIVLDVPDHLAIGVPLKYQLISSEITYSGGSDYFGSFYFAPFTAIVGAEMKVEAISTVIGRPNVFKVMDGSGNPMGGATVTITHPLGEFTGTTNADGLASVGQFAGPDATAMTVRAEKDGNTSFTLKTQSLIPFHAGRTTATVEQQLATPFNIISNAVEHAATRKNITWLSSVIKSNEASVVRYHKKSVSEDLSMYLEQIGTSSEQAFTGSTTLNNNGVVKINKAILTNLAPDTTYVFQVGDGEHWSEVKEFTTSSEHQEATNFFVLGDTQTADTTKLKSIFSAIDNDATTYAFAMQVGDFVDGAGLYGDLEAVNRAVSESEKLSTVDMIHALGNHEFMGDLEATAAKAYYNIPENGPEGVKGECYSVTYGDVYVAVISWTNDEASLLNQLEWIKGDKARHNKTWNFILTHQPVFYTNPSGGNGLFLQVFPSYMKEIGIDVVFSGHDHAYGRTAMLDGTTYFVCGTTGNKYYEAVNDGSFLVYNDEKEATYMTATINGNALTIKALRPDGRVIDTYTYVKNGDIASNDSNSATEVSVIQKVENAPTGSTVHIPMGSGQKLTSDILKALQGKDVTISLDYGKYLWTIHGATVQEGINMAEYDLTVKEIKEETITKMVTDKEVIQLEIQQRGAFAFLGKLTYPVDQNYNNKTVYLYYFNEKTGALEYCQSSIVREGKVSFLFDHASKYVVLWEQLPDAIPNKPFVNPFVDVDQNDWFYEGVLQATEKMLFFGTEANKFSPNAPMTRGMFVTVLARLDKANLSGYTTTGFDDVDMNGYYGKSVAWAVDHHIVFGMGGSKFNPDRTMTREQMAVMLNNYMKYKGTPLLPKDRTEAFSDETAISPWAVEAVAQMGQLGLMKGMGNNKFHPQEIVTRAQSAQTVVNYLGQE